MRLTLLGTGNAMATRCYNTCFVLEHKGASLLVDGGGGNGLLRQLELAQVHWQDLRHIFVTHQHLDHIMGIIWIMRLIVQYARQDKVHGLFHIYAHAEVTDLLRLLAERLLRAGASDLFARLVRLETVRDGETRQLPLGRMTFFDIGSVKTLQYGFALDWDGGRRLVCLGDEPCHPQAERFVRDCDWLLHEAFCLFTEHDRYQPYRIQHSTARDAAALAQRLNVKNLILYHTVDDKLERRQERYLAEGRQVYTGNLYVPDDLESLDLD